MEDFSVLIAGKAGFGIDKATLILGHLLQCGYRIYIYRHAHPPISSAQDLLPLVSVQPCGPLANESLYISRSMDLAK